MRAALVLLLLVGCGSRTGTLDRGVDTPDLDAGAPCCDASDGRGLDAGGRDAGGPPDAGACTWVIRELPVEVHRESGGVFVEPRAARAGDGSTDLVATFVPSAAGAQLITYAAQLDRMGAFSILSQRLLSVDSTAPVPAAMAGDRLLVCETQPSGEIRVQSLVRNDFAVERTEVVGVYERCLDVAGTGTRIGVAVHDGDTVWAAGLGEGVFAQPAPVPLSDASVTAVADALVWASNPDTSGRPWVLWSEGSNLLITPDGFGRQALAPVLAPWPFARGVAMLGRFTAPTLLVLDPLGGRIVRSEGVPGQMFEEPSPALARAGPGLLIARMNYGDLDPTTGLLELGQIDAAGEVDDTGLPLFPIRRTVALTGGEVSAAGDADSVVVHWSEVEGADAVTRALFLDCR